MEKTDFNNKLNDIQKTYIELIQTKHHSDKKLLENLEFELMLVLQDYLWEGFAFKTLNAKKYHALALVWHSDKIDDIQNKALDEQEKGFLIWYIHLTNKNAPFQALSTVKETYQPELKFRLQDINNTYKEIIDPNYFFSNVMPRNFPHIYNIFWPIFYALEVLERNLNNYQNLTMRKIATKIYIACSVAPYIILFPIVADYIFLPYVYGINLNILPLLASYLLTPHTFLYLTTMMEGVGFMLASVVLNRILYQPVTGKQPEINDPFTSVFIYPFELIPIIYNKLKNPPLHGSGDRPYHFLKYGAGLSLLTTVELALMAFYIKGLTVGLPFFAFLLSFPLVGLVLTNLPLLTYQIISQPKESLKVLGEYSFTVFNRYFSFIKKPFIYFNHLINSWRKKSATSQNSESGQGGIPSSGILLIEPKEIYWQRKIKKYSSLDDKILDEKVSRLRQERKEISEKLCLNSKLSEQLESRLELHLVNKTNSQPIEFPKVVSEKKVYQSLDILNLYSQLVYLKKAQQCQDLPGIVPEELCESLIKSVDKVNYRILSSKQSFNVS